MGENADVTWSLLGDLSEVPQGYLHGVAETKRVLERWTMDPKFREAFDNDAGTALASLGVSLRPHEVRPLISKENWLDDDGAEHDWSGPDTPLAVRRYRAFIREKLNHRGEIRSACEPADRRLLAWRRRQINRCVGELGGARSDAIVHAPAAFELTKGCTVGCWFCGVAAPKFDQMWRYSDEARELWRGTLQAVRDLIGPQAMQHGFLYWATDPLDNPDYERFLVDFHQVTGRCPQTTTALGHKDLERTRQLLRLTRSLDSTIDRFSVIALNHLNRLHEGLTPEEMLRVECVPQNRESGELAPKSNAGRARRFAEKRKDELVPPEMSSTIACVSGFLFNMIDRSVQLVTPCNASDNWPLGYWVLGRGTFDTPGELRDLLEEIVSTTVKTTLGINDAIRLRPDIRVQVDAGELALVSQGRIMKIHGQPAPDDLAAMLADGSYPAGQIAMDRERGAGVPMAHTFSILDEVFEQGMLDEDPASAKSPGVPAEVYVGQGTK